jgi:hypothetical protein
MRSRYFLGVGEQFKKGLEVVGELEIHQKRLVLYF